MIKSTSQIADATYMDLYGFVLLEHHSLCEMCAKNGVNVAEKTELEWRCNHGNIANILFTTIHFVTQIYH